jgi:hypothetical protein
MQGKHFIFIQYRGSIKPWPPGLSSWISDIYGIE